MACRVCGAEAQRKFRTEVAIHLSLDNPLVLVFPEIWICFNCGKPEFAEGFVVPEDELRLLSRRDAARG